MPAQAGALQPQPSQTLEQKGSQGMQSPQEGVAWQGELTVPVSSQEETPRQSTGEKIRKMRHHFGSKPKQFCVNRPSPHQDTLHLLSAGRGGKDRGVGSWSSTNEKEKIKLPKA